MRLHESIWSVAPGGAARDFLVLSEREHGVRGLVSLFGIESPGLTASLAIAERVAALVGALETDPT